MFRGSSIWRLTIGQRFANSEGKGDYLASSSQRLNLGSRILQSSAN